MKFSIRNLMWLTVVVALVLGWWLDHRRQADEIKAIKTSEFFEGSTVWNSDWTLPDSSAPAPIPREE